MPEVEVNGVKLVYEVRGQGPPVLLICGGQMSASMWWMSAGTALVDEGYTVIAFDNRGVPPSDVPPPPYSVEEMADDTIGLMEHLGMGPYAIMGASMGGMIAQTVALRRPELVRAVVFAVSGGNPCAYGREQGRSWIDTMKSAGEMPPAAFVHGMLSSLLTPTQLQDNEAVEGAIAMAGMFGTLPRNGMLGQFEAVLKWASEDHLSELSGLQVPALAIAHEHDLWFPPRYVKQAVDAMPNGEYVEIAGAAHVSLEKIEEPRPHVNAFLAKHQPGTSALNLAGPGRAKVRGHVTLAR